MRRPTPAGLLPWLIGATLLLATVGCSEPPAAMLLWFHPLQATEYPYHTYRVDIVDGIAILDIDGGELQALDVGPAHGNENSPAETSRETAGSAE